MRPLSSPEIHFCAGLPIFRESAAKLVDNFGDPLERVPLNGCFACAFFSRRRRMGFAALARSTALLAHRILLKNQAGGQKPAAVAQIEAKHCFEPTGESEGRLVTLPAETPTTNG